jgi:hypothetical protein
MRSARLVAAALPCGKAGRGDVASSDFATLQPPIQHDRNIGLNLKHEDADDHVIRSRVASGGVMAHVLNL